eukprot:8879598-Pyramimonas_sp.AAC.1
MEVPRTTYVGPRTHSANSQLPHDGPALLQAVASLHAELGVQPVNHDAKVALQIGHLLSVEEARWASDPPPLPSRPSSLHPRPALSS